MMYLMVLHPSMLPVSTDAEDLEPQLVKWVTSNQGDDGGVRTKLQILEHYTSSRLCEDVDTRYHFEPEQINGSFHLEQSLKEIKAMWLRLLIYAAGKCSGEVHARHLSEGGELITFVWLLMVLHGLGDVAQELSLFTYDEPYVPQPRFTVLQFENSIEQQPESLYTFVLGHQQAETAVVSHEREQIQLAPMVQDIVAQDLRAAQSAVEGTETQQDGATAPGGASVQYEAGASGEAGQDDDDAATPSEIDDQVEKTAMQIEGSRHA
jgi:hypothetical protein